MSEILVSALCTIYMAERFMRGLLEDLEAQTIADRMEIVIVDSGSPQNERAIVQEYQKRFSNIVYHRTENWENSHQGFNRCIGLARGKYVALACADDRHHPQAFERMASVLDARPDIALVYANSIITHEENQTFAQHTRSGVYRWIDFDPIQLLRGCYMGPQPMWRRSLHARYGVYDEMLKSAADWEFWLRLAERETFLHIDEFLGLYLYSATSSEHKDPALSQSEAEMVAQRYAHREGPLMERKRRIQLRLPAPGGIAALVVKSNETREADLESCCMAVRAMAEAGLDISAKVLRLHEGVPENKLGVTVSPPSPVGTAALEQASAVDAQIVMLLWPGIEASQIGRFLTRMTEETSLAALISSDPIHPTLILRSEAARAVGGLNTALPLPLAVEALCQCLRDAGMKVEELQDIAAPAQQVTAEEELAMYSAAAEAALRDNDAENARTVLERLTKRLPMVPAGHVALASVLQALGLPEEALAALEHAVQLTPEDADVLSQFGAALADAGSHRAEDVLLAALRAAPGNVTASLHLIALYRRRGDAVKTTAILRAALENAPAHPELLGAYADLCIEAGAAAHALEALRAAAPRHPAIARLKAHVEKATIHAAC